MRIGRKEGLGEIENRINRHYNKKRNGKAIKRDRNEGQKKELNIHKYTDEKCTFILVIFQCYCCYGLQDALNKD